ncbi:toll/interleukin-1 receptor domain-containing protein [Sandaracinobacter neustonicus]|uniref:Toll/interleukin-1 receptor domain-containing protein n=1 Tax=Sandaracinobacter neustonicus TaxID=1715348 RepID=A0A501XWZ5_9SPHN|nr:toll/interleukin-1 receptor domain-containing protein [Sandaracinobacter neustonicus]TPE65218.1 toll/interleukin-1 receptor domain-containing protein [Sandaracinobacter neustonicus]
MAKTIAPATRTEPVRLFISYAREDRGPVERLAHALEAAGFRVWWDAALEGGHHFAAEIERELEAADAVIVLWTAASVKSNWVLDEAMHGRDRGCLIPLRLDDTVPPLGFRQIQGIDLEEGQEAQTVEAIARAVARIRGLPVREPGTHPRSRPGNRPARERPVWVPFAWAVFGLISALIFWGLDRS